MSDTCELNISLNYTVEHVAGSGSWSPGAFLADDPVLRAGQPSNETVNPACVVPAAGSVAGGDQLVLKVTWSTVGYAGAGTYAESLVRIDSGSPGLPPECALIGSEMPPLGDNHSAYPRVFVDQACDMDLTLTYTVEHVSGSGTSSPGNFLADDPVLRASHPSNETVKSATVVPAAESVVGGDQMVLKVTWSILEYVGAGTRAESLVRIDSTN